MLGGCFPRYRWGRAILQLVPTEVSQGQSPAKAIVSMSADAAAREVERFGILDTVPEPAFDRITALAADLFAAPIALIGFIDNDEVFFKSRHGLDVAKVPRSRDERGSVLDAWIRRDFKFGFHAGVPLDTPDGYRIGTSSVIDRRSRRIEDIQMRRLRLLGEIVKDELAMRLAAREAVTLTDLMRSEVDHRAMNNLQFVASLLQLQSRGATTAETSAQLLAAAARVAAVARVHRVFAVDETIDRVLIVPHLRKLCEELGGILGCEIGIAGADHVSVPKRQILAIGLIANELIANARKHAAGPISVTFRSVSDDSHELCVLDEGQGLPDSFAAGASAGLGIGLKVVTALIGQLGGKVSAGPNPSGRGACIAVTFPAT